MLESPAPRNRLRNLTLLLASSLTVMAGTPVSPALPSMSAAFEHESSSDLKVRLMLTMPGLFIGLLAPASGLLVDRLGRKPLLLWGTVLYAVAGSSGLYLNSLWTILIGRAFLGIAVAGVMTAAVTLIGDYFTHAARHRFIGLQTAFMSFGGIIFLLGGGVLSDWSWRGPFAVYLAAVLVIPMILMSIDEPARDSAAAHHADGLMPPTAPGGVVALIYTVAFFGMVAFYAIPIQIPFHLRLLFDADGTYVGVAIATMTLFATIASLLYSRIKARLSFAAVVAVMLLGIGVGYLLIALATSFPGVLVGLVVAGMGIGLLMPNLNVWLMGIAPEASRGRLVGGLTMALFLGQFFSPILLAPLLTAGGTVGVFRALATGSLASMAVFVIYAAYESWYHKDAA